MAPKKNTPTPASASLDATPDIAPAATAAAPAATAAAPAATAAAAATAEVVIAVKKRGPRKAKTDETAAAPVGDAPSTEPAVAAAIEPAATPAKPVKKPRAKKAAAAATTSESGAEDDDERQQKVNTSELLALVIESMNAKAEEVVGDDATDKERKFRKVWTPLTNEQKLIIASLLMTTTFDTTKTKICEGFAVAFNGLITLKASCQLARRWLSPPTASGKPAEVGDRLRARFSICEDLKRKLADAPVPEYLKEKATARKNDAAAKAAVKAAKLAETALTDTEKA